MTKLEKIGRLAFRVEGKTWNCYWCPNQNNMKGKLMLGAIHMGIVRADEDIKNAFMELMRHTFERVSEETLGAKPHWKDPVRAPEDERSGSA